MPIFWAAQPLHSQSLPFVVVTMPVARRHSYARLIPKEDERRDSSATEGAAVFGLDEVRTGLIWPTSRPSLAVLVAARQPAPTATAFRDIKTLLRVFFVRGLFVGGRWAFPLLLAISAGAYETAAATVMNVIGDFYYAISSMNSHLFLQVLWRSLLVVVVIAILKACRDIAKECCALMWRRSLVSFLHEWYLRGKTPYHLSSLEREEGAMSKAYGASAGSDDTDVLYTRPLDSPDQRVTADAMSLTSAFAHVVHATVVTPCLVAYYTYFLVGLFGWTAPTACYLYFIVGSVVNWWVVKRVVPAVYAQEQAEGAFRYDHAWLRTHAEPVVFYGPEAVQGRERERLDNSFDAVVASSWFVIRRHVPLYVLTQFFHYLGSIINYAAIGLAILYMSKAEEKSQAEIAALVARSSYSCLYLINAFSKALDVSKVASRVAGSASRVAELLRATGFTDADARQLGPWSTASGTGKTTAGKSEHGDASRTCAGAEGDDERDTSGYRYSCCRSWFRNLTFLPWRKRSNGNRNGYSTGDATCSTDDDNGITTPLITVSDAEGTQEKEQGSKGRDEGIFCGSYWRCTRCRGQRATTSTNDHDLAYIEDGSHGRGYSEVGGGISPRNAVLSSGACTANQALPRESTVGGVDDASNSNASPKGDMIAGSHPPHWDSISICACESDEEEWLLRIEGFTLAHPQQQREGLKPDGEERSLDDANGACGGALGVGAMSSAEDESGSTPREQSMSAPPSIVRELTLTVRRGENLLVNGPSGCGKTSFLRGVAGLWNAEAGTMELAPRLETRRRVWEGGRRLRPLRGRRRSLGAGGGGVMFLPQQPYCFRGTLLEQVTYPSSSDVSSASKAVAILEELGLQHLILLDRAGGSLTEAGGVATSEVPGGERNIDDEGVDGPGGINSDPSDASPLLVEGAPFGLPRPGVCGGRPLWRRGTETEHRRRSGSLLPVSTHQLAQMAGVRDWAAILSPGEQQRLGVARVLYHRPALAFFDESTSAIAEVMERRIYERLEQEGITVVSVGHRASLREVHQHMLSLSGPPAGHWRLSDISS